MQANEIERERLCERVWTWPINPDFGRNQLEIISMKNLNVTSLSPAEAHGEHLYSLAWLNTTAKFHSYLRVSSTISDRHGNRNKIFVELSYSPFQTRTNDICELFFLLLTGRVLFIIFYYYSRSQNVPFEWLYKYILRHVIHQWYLILYLDVSRSYTATHVLHNYLIQLFCNKMQKYMTSWHVPDARWKCDKKSINSGSPNNISTTTFFNSLFYPKNATWLQ